MGLVLGLAGVAFLAAAIGTGIGGRRELMAAMALIAFALFGGTFIPDVAGPLLPATQREAESGPIGPIAAVALADRLDPRHVLTLMAPWWRAFDDGPEDRPPRRWLTAIFAGRCLVAAMTLGLIAFFSIGYAQQPLH